MAIRKMPPEERVKLEQDVEKVLHPYKTEAGYKLDSTMLIVSTVALMWP